MHISLQNQVPDQQHDDADRFPFFLVLAYLFFEYGRPQAFFPFLNNLHPGWIFNPLLLIFLISRQRLFYVSDPQPKYFLLLILLMMMHGPFARNNYYAYNIWRNSMLSFILYLGIIGFVDSISRFNKFIDLWLVIMIVCALVGISSGGRVPRSGFMGDENDFALVMNMAIPFAYFRLLAAETAKMKLCYLALCVIFLLAVISSVSRGGFVGMVPTIGYCWYQTPKKAAATMLLGLLVVVFLFSASESYWNEIKSIEQENIQTGTGEDRWYLWNIALSIFADHPIAGVGQGNAPYYVADYEPEGGLHGRSRAGRAMHSLYFTLIPELGLIGILLFSLIIHRSYTHFRTITTMVSLSNFNTELGSKAQLYTCYSLAGGFIAFLFSSIFLSTLYYPHIWFLTATLLAQKSVIQNYFLDHINHPNI